ncbi:hypothetical protein GCM10009872_48280 [Actinopolymorpha rutila]
MSKRYLGRLAVGAAFASATLLVAAPGMASASVAPTGNVTTWVGTCKMDDHGKKDQWIKGDHGKKDQWIKGDHGKKDQWTKGDHGKKDQWTKGDHGKKDQWSKGDHCVTPRGWVDGGDGGSSGTNSGLAVGGAGALAAAAFGGMFLVRRRRTGTLA